MEIEHYAELPEYDPPAIAYCDGAYYARFNDPPEFLDVPGYIDGWQNLDGMERDRRVHIIHTAGVNGQNLDYVPDWYPTNYQAIDFEDATPEELEPLFGVNASVNSTELDLVPGDLILRDQRWVCSISGKTGDRLIQVDGLTEEIADKFITTFVSRALDSAPVKAFDSMHIEVDLFEAGRYVEINGKRFTVVSYRRGMLYVDEEITGISIGDLVYSYWDQFHIPMGDNDHNAFASGATLEIAGERYYVLDHYPNARSIVQGINGEPMCDPPRYQLMQDHPNPNTNSRFLPECWAQCGLPTTQIYLQSPLTRDYDNEPCYIRNKQWYVATCEVLEFPEDHKPLCWPILRLGGAELPYRFRRFIFNSWKGQMLPGDLVYSYGQQIDPPFVEEHWVEGFNMFPNWYQLMENDEWATFTRVLTVPDRDFLESMGNFADMFVCNLKGNGFFMNLPIVTENGIEQEQWQFPLFGAEFLYV